MSKSILALIVLGILRTSKNWTWCNAERLTLLSDYCCLSRCPNKIDYFGNNPASIRPWMPLVDSRAPPIAGDQELSLAAKALNLSIVRVNFQCRWTLQWYIDEVPDLYLCLSADETDCRFEIGKSTHSTQSTDRYWKHVPGICSENIRHQSLVTNTWAPFLLSKCSFCHCI
jgi:hypothetical protein